MAAIRILGGVAAALAACVPAPGGAVDWRLNGFFSQRFEVEQDTRAEDGTVLGTVSDLGGAVSVETARTRWLFAPGVRLVAYSDQNFDLGSFVPRFNGSVAHRMPRYSIDANLSFVPERVDQAQFEDTGLRAGGSDALQLTLGASGAFRYEVDSINRISLSANARTRTFTEQVEGLNDNRSFGADLSWRRSVSELSGVFVSMGYQRFLSDGGETESSDSYSLRVGGDRRLSPRLTASGSIGLSYTLSEPGPDAPPDVQSDALGLVGGLNLDYETPLATFSVGLSQSVDQNSDGRVENVSSLSVGARRQLTPAASVGLASRFGVQLPLLSDGAENRQTFSVSPSFQYALSRDWTATAGYSFRLENEESLETVNTVFIQLSRGLSLLP